MATTTEYRPPATLALRVALTLAGAAGLIIGSFLEWVSDTGSEGTKIPVKVFWSTDVGQADAAFLASAGFVTIVLGLVALLGLALRTGGLTRLAGALGVIAFVLFLITLYRVPGADLTVADIGIGMWLVLVGGVLALIGGFMGNRAVMTTTAAPATAPPPPPA